MTEYTLTEIVNERVLKIFKFYVLRGGGRGKSLKG